MNAVFCLVIWIVFICSQWKRELYKTFKISSLVTKWKIWSIQCTSMFISYNCMYLYLFKKGLTLFDHFLHYSQTLYYCKWWLGSLTFIEWHATVAVPRAIATHKCFPITIKCVMVNIDNFHNKLCEDCEDTYMQCI